jgi:hypothetical protein
MATTEIEEVPANTFTVVQRTTRAVETATGTDDRLTIRALLAFIVIGITIAVAPFPANVAGVIALVVLVLEAARMAWKRK